MLDSIAHSQAMADAQSKTRHSKSPSPPPWSPISPAAEIPANLPPSVPISAADNTDVIALRAALSVLQMQRLRSARNIQTLDRQRKLALAHPEEFRQGLVDGTIRSQHEAQSVFDEEESQGEEDENQDESTSTSPLKDFGQIPAPLNVIRCPPVNWAKYHVAGEVLDQLHEQQRRLPESGHISQALPSRPHAIAAPYSPWHDKVVETLKAKNSVP